MFGPILIHIKKVQYTNTISAIGYWILTVKWMKTEQSVNKPSVKWSACEPVLQVGGGLGVLQQRLSDVIKVQLVGQPVAAVHIITVSQQALRIGSDAGGSAIEPETTSGTVTGEMRSNYHVGLGNLSTEMCHNTEYRSSALLSLHFENVLKQVGGERTVGFELLQVNKVSLQDHLLVQNLNPIWTVAVRLRHNKHLRDRKHWM